MPPVPAELQPALEHYTEFYDAAPVGFLTLDPQGCIRQLNSTFASLLGSERSALLNQYVGRFVEVTDRPAFDAFLETTFTRNGKGSCELSLRHPDHPGISLFVHIDATRARTGESCSAVIVDITERKRAERLLVSHRNQLENAVDERTTELIAANEALEAFTYAVSHDIKGPLSRINSFSQLLDRRYRDCLDGDGRQILDFIRQNATRLTQLVDELLGHARATQQLQDLRPLDLEPLVQATIGDRMEDIRDRHAEVSVQLPPVRVLGDGHALRQVLANLLENALKYSGQAVPPRIEVGGDVVGGSYRLWVRDNGIGFDMQYHDRIFDIFHRLHSYNEIPGTGVGLALVKRATERMGGKVWAESSPGQGAIFFVQLQTAS